MTASVAKAGAPRSSRSLERRWERLWRTAGSTFASCPIRLTAVWCRLISPGSEIMLGSICGSRWVRSSECRLSRKGCSLQDQTIATAEFNRNKYTSNCSEQPRDSYSGRGSSGKCTALEGKVHSYLGFAIFTSLGTTLTDLVGTFMKSGGCSLCRPRHIGWDTQK